MTTKNKALQVWLTQKAKQKLDLYIAATTKEISGIGEVSVINGHLLVTDVYLFTQEVTSGSTELDGDALAEFLSQAVMEGKDTSHFKLWWHSHANMNVFWSSTDDKAIDDFADAGWMLSIVGNRAGDYLARIDLYEPFRITENQLPIKVLVQYPDGLEEQIQAEVAEKVTEKKVTYTRPTYYRGAVYRYDGGPMDNWDDDWDDYEPPKRLVSSHKKGAIVTVEDEDDGAIAGWTGRRASEDLAFEEWLESEARRSGGFGSPYDDDEIEEEGWWKS